MVTVGRVFRQQAARPVTLEEVATAPVGTLLVPRDEAIAWRKTSLSKSGWVRQKPTASSLDGWGPSGRSEDSGQRVFLDIVKFLRKEALYDITPRHQNPQLPSGFEGFDFFGGNEPTEPVVLSPETEAKIQVERHLGAMGSVIDPSHVLKVTSLVQGHPPAVYFWQKQMAWYVWAGDGSTAEDAEVLAGKLWRALISERSLGSASIPSLHKRTLYVGYEGGYFVSEPPAKAPKAPTMGDRKDALIQRAKATFGNTRAKLSGSASGGYVLHLAPKGANAGVIRFSTVEEGREKLEQVISQYEAMTPVKKNPKVSAGDTRKNFVAVMVEDGSVWIKFFATVDDLIDWDCDEALASVTKTHGGIKNTVRGRLRRGMTQDDGAREVAAHWKISVDQIKRLP